MSSAETAPREVRHLECGAGENGQRIDNFLLRVLKGVPRSRIYRLLRKGEVRVNGRRAAPDRRLQTGDVVRLPPVRTAAAGEAPRRPPEALLSRVQAAVIHEDARILALDKPPGLAVHGGSGLSFGVIEALRAVRPGADLELVHRLDRETSGVLLVAKDRGALRLLHALLREGEVAKSYRALLQGKWTLGRKRIDLPLKTNLKQGGERVVKVHAQGKDAASTFEPLTVFGRTATLAEIEIHTGRTHQIRVHAAFAGHPVAGDDKYGDREFNLEMKRLGLSRMFLHAHSLAFSWPDSGERCRITAPMPADLQAVVERLGKTEKRIADSG